MRDSGCGVIELLTCNETRPSTPLACSPSVTVRTDNITLCDLDKDVRPKAIAQGLCDGKRLLCNVIELEHQDI